MHEAKASEGGAGRVFEVRSLKPKMTYGHPASISHHLRKYESDSTLLQRHTCVRRLTRPKYPPVLSLVFAFAEIVHAKVECRRWRWDD